MGAPRKRVFPESQVCIVCNEEKQIAAFMRKNAPCRPPRQRCDVCNDAILASGKSRQQRTDAELHAALNKVGKHGQTAWERFWAQVDKRPGGCWIWTGAIHQQGYGTFCVGRYNWRTHRLSYAIKYGVGEIYKVMVCHECDNPACVNPAHLWTGRHRDNMKDMVRKARRAGSRNSAAVLDEETVMKLRRSDLPHKVWADRLGVHHSSIYKARVGIKWGHLPDAWPRTERAQ